MKSFSGAYINAIRFRKGKTYTRSVHFPTIQYIINTSTAQIINWKNPFINK